MAIRHTSSTSSAWLLLELQEALTGYRRLVRRRTPQYRLLELLRQTLLGAPDPMLRSFVWLAGPAPLLRPAQRGYGRIVHPDLLRPGRVRRPHLLTATLT